MNLRSYQNPLPPSAAVHLPCRLRPAALAARLLMLAVLVVALLNACGGAPPPTPAVARVNTPTRPAEPTAPPTAVRPGQSGTLTLTWWSPEFLSPQAPQPTGQILAQQLAGFTATQDGKVVIEVPNH